MNITQNVAPHTTGLIDAAGNMLTCYDTQDRRKPSLFELTGISQHGMATLSGLNDYDYENLQTLSMGHKSLDQIRTVSKTPIPTEILEHFKHIKCHCSMGLFPEIGRAWLTIDSEIYIWTYEHSRDVAYYDGLNHLIVSVGLVKPKTSVFVNNVKYLLLLTTPIEIVVLGVTFSGNKTNGLSPTHRLLHNTSSPYNEMQLMNNPVFILSNDNVSMNVIKGCNNGRIFLGGRDGCLYEIYYQASTSWFGKRYKKMNLSKGMVSYMMPNFLKVFSEIDPIENIEIDNSRNLLYILTEKGAVEAWNLGTNYSNTRRLGRITQNEIVNVATRIVKTVDPSVFKSIKAICPLKLSDSDKLHLIAVTQCGVRLYFSTTDSLNVSQYYIEKQQQQQQQQQTAQNSPMECNDENKQQSGIYLLHVRIPPGYTPNTTTNKPKQVHAAYFSEGTLLMATTPQQEQDLLWSISSMAFPNCNYLVESTTVELLDGVVWSLVEVPDKIRLSNSSLLYKDRKPQTIAMLTNQGTHIMNLLRPVDLLHQLLSSCNGPHHEAVKAFFQTQTVREACVTCLLLATSEDYCNSEARIWATQAFLLYGGEPCFPQQLNPNQMSHNRSMHNVTSTQPQMYMSTPMPPNPGVGGHTNLNRTPLANATIQQSQYPLSPISAASPQSYPLQQHQQQQQHITSSIHPNEGGGGAAGIIYSAKHDALYLYVARMVRPIWNMHCVNQNLCSNIQIDDCKLLLNDLFSLRAFLEANSVNDISSSNRINGRNGRTNGYHMLLLQNSTTTLNCGVNEQRNAIELAHAEEKRSLTALNQLIKHVCEVISLWDIMIKHDFQCIILQQLTREQQIALKSCTFRDLILTRTDICATLVIALINSYLKDDANVSVISANLRELCPNLYRHEDAVTYKATEILMSAKNCVSLSERKEKLLTALKMCKEAAPLLPLHSICQQFTNAGFYEGVVELSAACAAKNDVEEYAIHYYKNGEPAEDREGYSFYVARMNCYKEVRLTLDHIYQSTQNAQDEEEQNRTQFMETELMNNHTHVSATCEIQKIVNPLHKVINLALDVDDPLMHVIIYEWLMVHEMFPEMLNLSVPSLGEFLSRNAARNPENLNIIDLLWKYYENNQQHIKAAHILDDLASKQNPDIALENRIEYLGRAILCIRNASINSTSESGKFLRALEDKLDIARVQKSILNDVLEISRTSHAAAKAAQDLNCALYEITQLYQNFAEPFNLWECQLIILNCSNHNDPLLIESVWGNIINKYVDGPGSAYERSNRLFTKIAALVGQFGESGHCFPFAFIIKEMEIKACQLRLPEGTVPEQLINMGLDIELIMEYYTRMISMNERIWANEGREWHLIESANCLIKLLANNAHTIWYRSKRRVIAKGLDIISLCLNMCYQKPDTVRIQESLKELQCRLHRLLN